MTLLRITFAIALSAVLCNVYTYNCVISLFKRNLDISTVQKMSLYGSDDTWIAYQNGKNNHCRGKTDRCPTQPWYLIWASPDNNMTVTRMTRLVTFNVIKDLTMAQKVFKLELDFNLQLRTWCIIVTAYLPVSCFEPQQPVAECLYWTMARCPQYPVLHPTLCTPCYPAVFISKNWQLY